MRYDKITLTTVVANLGGELSRGLKLGCVTKYATKGQLRGELSRHKGAQIPVVAALPEGEGKGGTAIFISRKLTLLSPYDIKASTHLGGRVAVADLCSHLSDIFKPFQ